MFHDRNQELERLSEELWEEAEEEYEEEYDEDLDEDEDFEDYDEDFEDDNDFDDDEEDYPEAVNVRAYNADRTDTDLDEFSDEVYYAPKSKFTGLLIAGGILVMAVFLALVYLVLQHYGMV